MAYSSKRQYHSSALENETDQEHWTGLCHGNREALAQLYNVHADILFNYGMLIRPNAELVKDCMHDLFLDLWKQREHLSRPNNVKHYLFRSLRRKIVKAVERDRKLFDQETPEHYRNFEISLPFENEMIDAQQKQEISHRLSQVLAKLPERQKEVIELIFFEQMSYEDVSGIMSINIRSVYTLTWKAITSMKRYLRNLLVLLIVISIIPA